MVGRDFCSWKGVVRLGSCVVVEGKFIIFIYIRWYLLVGGNKNLVEIYLSDCLVCSLSKLTDRVPSADHPTAVIDLSIKREL